MRRLDRGPLCLTCMGAWEAHLTSHDRCRGFVTRLGKILACRCWCWDDATPELPPAPQPVRAPARRRSNGPRGVPARGRGALTLL